MSSLQRRTLSYGGNRDANHTDDTGALWHRSSHSSSKGACVEAADLSTAVALRDSTRPAGERLHLPTAEWSAFLTAVKESRL
ncbi:DUF397 domain-containing protein [Salinactinospora qingdaonensis]|uniref:DUF397 domain-containing protein n=1 Tax=Salinactinospora qingdaonensis TaxID=702744 RepID=A0ABP7FL62_9ACTN